jgi:hypothetical protein
MGEQVPEPEENRGPLIDINLLQRDGSSAPDSHKRSIKGPSSVMPPIGDAEDEESDEKSKKPASTKLPVCRFHNGRRNGRQNVCDVSGIP